MANKTRSILGLTLITIGIALMVFNALDYLMKWGQMDSSVSAIGLMLVVIGGGFPGRAREGKPVKKR